MITHPGSRTRALYQWEHTDLKWRAGAKQVSFGHARWIVMLFGIRYRVSKDSRVVILDRDGDPECIGRSLIRLTRNDHLNVTLIHELTHALGFGSPTNPHSRGFVLRYIDALAWWFGWDKEELELLAHQHGLL